MKLDYLHLAPEGIIPRARVRPFRAVLIAEQGVSEVWRNEVAAWLVNTGCLYFIAWGVSCEVWHDSVDWAVLENFNFGDVPDERFVMTTWHDKEPLSEALWFAGNCASHPVVDLEETVIVHVAPEERRIGLMDAYRDSEEAPGGR